MALAVIGTTQLMVVLDASIVNVALPSIQRALHVSGANLAWVINAYKLTFGGLLLLGGRTGFRLAAAGVAAPGRRSRLRHRLRGRLPPEHPDPFDRLRGGRSDHRGAGAGRPRGGSGYRGGVTSAGGPG